jgi:3-deoxy-D-manno-octulosonic-acid transferase
VRRPLRLAYEAVALLARTATTVAPAGGSKILRALADRNGLLDRYRDWSASNRDAGRPLLWMHAPSVGEGLMARPVLQRFRQSRPALQLAYTWYSPSAVSFSRGLDVDFRDYLPVDTTGDSAAAIDALRPAALVFSKLDVCHSLRRLIAAIGNRPGRAS